LARSKRCTSSSSFAKESWSSTAKLSILTGLGFFFIKHILKVVITQNLSGEITYTVFTLFLYPVYYLIC
jgi:hypothetical protein